MKRYNDRTSNYSTTLLAENMQLHYYEISIRTGSVQYWKLQAIK